MAKDAENAPATVPAVGLTLEQLQMILNASGQNAAVAMREAQKLSRKENPNYPEKSVFNPEGKFDDHGNPKPAKVVFRIPTFFSTTTGVRGVRLREDEMTAEEIQLCNRITEPKTARGGRWLAELKGNEYNRELWISVPGHTLNERNELPSFILIVAELLEGPNAVTPESLIKRIEELERQQKAAAA